MLDKEYLKTLPHETKAQAIVMIERMKAHVEGIGDHVRMSAEDPGGRTDRRVVSKETRLHIAVFEGYEEWSKNLFNFQKDLHLQSLELGMTTIPCPTRLEEPEVSPNSILPYALLFDLLHDDYYFELRYSARKFSSNEDDAPKWLICKGSQPFAESPDLCGLATKINAFHLAQEHAQRKKITEKAIKSGLIPEPSKEGEVVEGILETPPKKNDSVVLEPATEDPKTSLELHKIRRTFSFLIFVLGVFTGVLFGLFLSS